jgi:hypothetical protein
MNLNGIFTAITTPFDADGAVAVDRLRENIARLDRRVRIADARGGRAGIFHRA